MCVCVVSPCVHAYVYKVVWTCQSDLFREKVSRQVYSEQTGGKQDPVISMWENDSLRDGGEPCVPKQSKKWVRTKGKNEVP